jgi:hypothetical protein
MRVLRPVVAPALIPAVVLAACVAGVTACSSLDKALGQTEALVSFQDGTSNAVRMQVRATCGKLPNVTPAPLPSGVPQSESLDQVVFNVSNASVADKARLQVCLEKYKSAVAGLDYQDSTDLGS